MKKWIVLALLLIIMSPLAAQEGHISGKVYVEYMYNKDENPSNEFEIHRAYFGYDKKLSDMAHFNLLTDVGRNGSTDSRLNVYLKSANISLKSRVGQFIIGLQSMNIFKTQEKNWGYRFVEKSPMDLYKWSSSSDLGFGYKNTIQNVVQLWALVTNGTGYKKPEDDKYKKYSVQLSAGDAKLKKANFNAGIVASYEPFADSTGTDNMQLYGLFGGVKSGSLKGGVEVSLLKNSFTDVTGRILAVYMNYKVNEKTDIFGRFDSYDPNTDNNNDAANLIIIGANYLPEKGVYIAPNIRMNDPQTGDSSTTYRINFQYKF